MNKLLPLMLLLLLSACTHQPGPASAREEKLRAFRQALREGKSAWPDSTPPALRAALARYREKARLANGLVYGDSVRNLDLGKNAPGALERAMKQRSCARLEDFLHDPKTGAPALCKGRPVRQVLFDCPDGGLLRLKLDGDPCSRQRPQPHGVKAVRDPYNGDPRSFSTEAFKVDREGNAIPKSPALLAPGLDADGWAEDAHADLQAE